MPINSYYAPCIFNAFEELVVVESKRHGGYSPAPYHSLNLGLHTEDELANVLANRDKFFKLLNIDEKKLAHSYQVHGDQIIVVDKPGYYEGYDALICDKPAIFLSVTVADCTPVLVYDAARKAIAAIHAGWRGTIARIVEKTIAAMQAEFDTKPESCFAFIGTCIDACSFEVDEDVADHFENNFKSWDAEYGKYFIDLKAANLQQLRDAGIPQTQIEVSTSSTFTDAEDYFSYRRENCKTGRMLALIGLRNKA